MRSLNYSFKNVLAKEEKFSLANMIAFPEKINDDLIHTILFPKENDIIEICITDTGCIIGGMIAKIIPSYQIIYLDELAISRNLKSKIYGLKLMDRLAEIGLQAFQSNFKGIICTPKCKKDKKTFDEKNKYKLRCMINSGAKIIIEQAKVKNDYFHLVFLPYNGGRDELEAIEIFKKLV